MYAVSMGLKSHADETPKSAKHVDCNYVLSIYTSYSGMLENATSINFSKERSTRHPYIKYDYHVLNVYM